MGLKPIKYIFLDIDGVLWTVQWSIYCNRNGEQRSMDAWDPMLSSNLQWVLDQGKKHGVDVRIVVSSTWRLGRTIEELKALFVESGLDPSAVRGKTPAIYFKKPRKVWVRYHGGPWYKRILPFRTDRTEAERGEEIQYWMDQRGIKAENILIIDDDSDMAHLKHRHLQTDSSDGFTFKCAVQAVKMLEITDD
jgi:hypothetical protein